MLDESWPATTRLRAEFTNAFNQVNFNNPVATLANSRYGQIVGSQPGGGLPPALPLPTPAPGRFEEPFARGTGGMSRASPAPLSLAFCRAPRTRPAARRLS